MRRSRRVSMALVGLLVLSVFSLTTASGRRADEDTRGKPAEKVKVSLRRISSSETMDILQKFPEMVPSYLASRKDDRELLTSVFRFSEVTAAPLRRAFPAARCYEYQGFTSPPYPYLMAVAGGKREMMPGAFNRLLFASGLKVTDKNIIDLAKAFVLLAVGSEPIFVRTDMPLGLDTFPPVTFLEAKRISELISGISYDAWLKVKIDDRVEEWYFDRWYGQFAVVSRGNAKGLIKQYDLPDARPLPQRGQLDETPTLTIDTFPDGLAYLELDGSLSMSLG
jgi:hypothetical protein